MMKKLYKWRCNTQKSVIDKEEEQLIGSGNSVHLSVLLLRLFQLCIFITLKELKFEVDLALSYQDNN